jgi:hypothetical protein
VAAASYQLEHFYYGQFVRQGTAEGEPRLLAHSAGIRQELAGELAAQNPLPPLDGVPDGAWAIVRGKSVPFIMIQAQRGAGGQIMHHYVVVQSDVLRALGGNLDALRGWVEAEMPVYDRLGDRLPPLEIPQEGPPTAEEQIEHILELMTYTHNRTEVIESLLSAVVSGVPMIVRGAPAALEPRVNFIKGLLALLPPPARFGVTFATHSELDTPVDAQIRFLEDEQASAEALVFHWPDAQIIGPEVEDGYSHFIISQLRLDAELVIKETQALTPIAAWRIRLGEPLAAALAYASYRKALDRALQNNLPVEIDDVSNVLAQDRTLDNDMRRLYANHLLTFSLALGDMQYADPLAVLVRQDSEIETATFKRLDEALSEGQAELVYSTLARWLGNPMGPQGKSWVQLAHRAILAHMDQLGSSGDVESINNLLIAMQQADPGLEISRVVPRLVEMALPLSLRYQRLVETIFLLAINYMDADVLTRLLSAPRFVSQLPAPVGRLVPYLEKQEPNPAPAGLLMDVAGAFGDNWRPVVLLRMAEAGVAAGRLDLLDETALAGLAAVAQTQWRVQYADLLRRIVQALSSDERLPALDEPFRLLQILLLLGDYGELAREMLHQSRVLYPGDAQVDYALMVQRLFAETRLDAVTAITALQSIEAGGIRSVPLLMGQIGVLQSHDDQEILDPLAGRITTALFNDPTILGVMQHKPMHDLLRYYLRRRDVPGAARIASLFPEVAAQHGTDGIMMMIRMYKAMYRGEDKELQIAGLELLRRYIRQSDTASARRAITHFGRELGLKVREALEATYQIKRLMSGINFDDYSQFLHLTAELLESTARAYMDKNNPPTLGALVNAVQSLSGGLMDEESNAIAAAVLGMGQCIAALGEDYRSRAPRDVEKHIDSLLKGETDPRCALDVLWVMGGYFAKGRRYRLRMRAVPHPLGERSAPALKEDAEISQQLLRGVLQAFPPDKEMNVTTEAIRGEVDSLWGLLDEAMRRDRVRDLAIDLQRVAQLVAYISENGDARVVQVNAAAGRKLDDGKTQPRSTLEFYRYLYGYFKIGK